MGREELCKRISVACVGSACSVWATLGLPLLTACVLSRSTLLRLQVVLQGTVQSRPWVLCTSQLSAAQVQLLRYSTKVQTHLGLHVVPFPGLSSSGNQVLGKHTLPRWAVCLITSPVPAARFPGCTVGAQSQVCCVSGELISDCNPPGRCQPSRIPGSLG